MTKDERQDIHNSEVPVVCRSCEARHRGVCGVLEPVQLIRLAKHTTQIEYDSAEELISVGQNNERYSNILSGVVKLTKLMADGRQQIVGLQFAPDFLGRPFRRTSTVFAEAATKVRVCSFPKSVLEELIKESPKLEHKLHEQTLKELDEARDWLLALGRKTAAEKVASFLYLVVSNLDPEKTSDENTCSFELPLRRSDIADFLGLTTETVSRQITKLRKSGIVVVEHNRHVTIPDLAALEKACEESH